MPTSGDFEKIFLTCAKLFGIIGKIGKEFIGWVGSRPIIKVKIEEMKVVIISSKKSVLGWLTKIFTGSWAYHIGFYSEHSGYFYDMYVMRRRQVWTRYVREDMVVEMFDCPVTEKYLEQKVLNRNKTYGIADYVSFFFRWLGFKVKNRNGLICSEMVNNDLRHFGVKTPWKESDAPPAPGDILEWYKHGKSV